MPSTISRTYGRKAPPKRKTSPSDDEFGDPKRRKVTPVDEDELPHTVQPKARSRSPPAKTTQPAPTATPTKMTKRMLGRSKTESSIDNQASTSLGSRTASLPVIPSSSSQTPLEAQSQEQERRPTLTASASTPRIKRTYAGASRSFLVPLGPTSDSVTGLGGESQEDDFHEPESYSSLRQRLGLDIPDDDLPLPSPPTPSKSKSKGNKTNSNNSTPARRGRGKATNSARPAVYLPPNMMNPLKSITELRSKGESRRFLDEVGYLFEGMDPAGSAPLKRSSASEITSQLCDDEFARKAKAADFYQKAWDVFIRAGAGRGEDKILDILLVFLVALIARNADTLLDLAQLEPSTSTSTSDIETSFKSKGKGKEKADPHVDHQDTLIKILFSILRKSADEDPLFMVSPLRSCTDLEFKRVGLNKKDRIMLSNIYSMISTKSRLFSTDTPITTTLLVTNILRTLPPSLLPTLHISDLLHSLRSLLHTSFPPNQPFNGTYPSTSITINDEDDSDDEGENREPQYECIRNHLHLLDAYLLGLWQNGESAGDLNSSSDALSEINAARDEWFIDGLIAVAICAKMKLGSNGGEEGPIIDIITECLEVLLRVFVNLTHGDLKWAQSVISNEFGVPFIVHLLASSYSSAQEEKRIDEEVKPKLEDNTDSDTRRPGSKSKSAHSSWDLLCLALGLLTNLVQSVPEFRNVLRGTKVSPKCTLSNPSCTKTCTCPGLVGSLELLAQVYNSYSPLAQPSTSNGAHGSTVKREDSPELPPDTEEESADVSADKPLILGTLSILFGLLMSSAPQNQTIILSNIHPIISKPGVAKREGGSASIVISDRRTKRAKLERLVEQAKDFVLVYDTLSSQNTEGDGRDDNSEETRGAREVLRVLEQLRDEC